MKNAEEILKEYLPEITDVNQSEPVEILPLTIVDMMEEYATQYLKATNNNDCYFCKYSQDDIHNRPDFCVDCFASDDNPYFELP